MTEKKLSTGKKVLIRKLTRKQITSCRDIVKMRHFPDGSWHHVGVHECIDAWVELGLGGLEDWKASNGEIAPEDVLMQLTQDEQTELAKLIQEVQFLNPKKPLH